VDDLKKFRITKTKSSKNRANKSRARARRGRAQRSVGFGTSARVSNAAVAVGSTLPSQNPMSVRDVRDPALGIGLCVTGSEPLGFASVYGSGATYAYAYQATLGAGSEYGKVLSPALLPTGQLINFAGMYTAYRFKSINIRYVPAVGTSTSATLIFAVVFDSSAAGVGMSAITYPKVAMNTFVCETPAWKPATLKVQRCPRMQNAYYCDQSNASGTTLRMNDQAVLLCLADNVTATAYGRWYIDYVIEFFCRSALNDMSAVSLNSALRSPIVSEKEKTYLKDLSNRLRYSDGFGSTWPPTVQHVDIAMAGGAAFGASVPAGTVPVVGTAGDAKTSLSVLTTFPDTVAVAYDSTETKSQIPVVLTAPLPTVVIEASDAHSEYQNPRGAVSVASPPTPALRKSR